MKLRPIISNLTLKTHAYEGPHGEVFEANLDRYNAASRLGNYYRNLPDHSELSQMMWLRAYVNRIWNAFESNQESKAGTTAGVRGNYARYSL